MDIYINEFISNLCNFFFEDFDLSLILAIKFILYIFSRFEHTNMGQTVNLFKSLELCKSLERIVLIAGYHTIAFQRAWIQRLFENNLNLILFIAQIPSITKENAKATEKSIKMR